MDMTFREANNSDQALGKKEGGMQGKDNHWEIAVAVVECDSRNFSDGTSFSCLAHVGLKGRS